VIQISGLTKYFGEQLLFKDVNLTISPREKIGLVGRNGAGKSTFLRILTGEEVLDDGKILLPKNFVIRALEQNLRFDDLDVISQIATKIPDFTDDQKWKIESVLLGLGFEIKDFSKKAADFSSGFQIRIRLAEALLGHCDLLLLDEPTNYLDIVSLRWLESFLKTYMGGFLLVTHNRHFMSAACEHTLGIHRNSMRKMKGSPKKLMEQILREEEILEKTRLNQIKKRQKTEKFIREFRSGARSAGLVQSRIKSLAKQDIGEKLSEIPVISFDFPYLEFKGNYLLTANNLSFSYDSKDQLIKSFSIEVRKGDRLAVVGQNGRGKSTLLRLLAGKLNSDGGGLNTNIGVEMGYFGADCVKELDETKTILQEVAHGNSFTEQEVRGVLATLLFRGDEIKKKVANLSGGEKRRVILAKILLKKTNLLILDEPTNHLDMESVEALVSALRDYEGTVIFVSHDEGVIESLANRLIVFDKGIRVFENDYQAFLQNYGWSTDHELLKFTTKVSSKKNDFLERKALQKKLKKITEDIEYVCEKIEEIEKEKLMLGEKLTVACESRNVQEIERLGIEIKKNQELSDKLLEVLEKLMQREKEISE
jgi:ATP-binding cassette subfamily F protein 3